MKNPERSAVILRYASLAAREHLETDPSKLELIQNEKREIEKALSLAPEKILSEAGEIALGSLTP